jgi:anthranilate phosphoribosyltransferase
VIGEVVSRIVDRHDLSEEEMVETMREITEGLATPSQVAAFATGLRMKGETVAEITGAARVLREKAHSVEARLGEAQGFRLVDTCGTGGDGQGTFNISTAVAFVAAGAGARVAKHGNRSATSKCGSADVMAALGVRIDLAAEAVARCIEEIGIGFLYAPGFHIAMRHVAQVRREIGIRTIFNILGPLANPARPSAQVLGVSSPELTEIMAHVLLNLGSERAFVVHGTDGLDEITVTGETKVTEVTGGTVRTYAVHPDQFGVPVARLEELKGGDAVENKEIILRVLGGEKGPRRNVVLVNASAALVAAGVAESLREGVVKAEVSLDEGRALERLERLVEITNAH